MKSFTISPPPGEVPTLQGNTGTITFTVTNTATRTVDGTVLAKPTAPAEESWFSFPDGATRTYQPGAVMSVATTVTAPPGTPAGTYTFRLDAKAEDNPDEDYTEGPSAQFVVPETPRPVPWWKRYWWIAAIVAVVLVGIVIAVLLLTGGDDDAAGGGEPKAEIPERNCATIDPATIEISGRPEIDIPLTVSASGQPLGTYASRADAERVAQLARAFRLRCSVGAIEYWLQPTGEAPPEEPDCVEYDPGRVVIVEQSETQFAVQDPQGPVALGTVTTQADADDLKAVAAGFERRCFIGRGVNRRPIRGKDFDFDFSRRFFSIMDFWL